MNMRGLLLDADYLRLFIKAGEEVVSVLERELPPGSPEKAARIVREATRRVERGRTDLEELVIHKNLKKPIGDYETEGPHVIAAKRLRKAGREVEPGMEGYPLLPLHRMEEA